MSVEGIAMWGFVIIVSSRLSAGRRILRPPVLGDSQRIRNRLTGDPVQARPVYWTKHAFEIGTDLRSLYRWHHVHGDKNVSLAYAQEADLRRQLQRITVRIAPTACSAIRFAAGPTG
jgi:hypothetical protein